MRTQIAIGALAGVLMTCWGAAAGQDDSADYEIAPDPVGVVIRSPAGPMLRYVSLPLRDVERRPSVESVGFIHPLYTPSGQIVTDCAPEDHPHHRGVFVGWVDMETAGGLRADFWGWGALAPVENRAVVTDSFVVAPGTGTAVADNRWMADGEVLMAEETQLRLDRTDVANVVDLTLTLSPATGDVTIAANPFGGFCYRARPGGQVEVWGPEGVVDLANSVFNDAQTNWPASAWYDLTYRDEDGVRGCAVVDHPDNPASTWHVHRGIHMLNPSIAAGEPYTIGADEPLVLRYRLIAHDGDPEQAGVADLARAFRQAGE